MAAEFGSLVDTGTFEYVDAPEGRKVITCKWVFSVKRNQWNEFERFKARLVARGFTQIYGINYQETFAPVVKFTSLRIMFALAAHYGLTIYQMYVVTAFLNADLDKEIYMSQPPGLPPKLNARGEEMVLKLHKSIYGLKQASRQWYRLIDSIFKSLGFTRLKSDHSLYLCRRREIIVIIALYVEDLQGATNNEPTWNVLNSKLSTRLKMKDLGVASYCLGLEITQDLDAQTVRISQKKYFQGVLERFGMADCRAVSTPLPVGTKLTKDMGPSTREERELMVGKDYLGGLGSVMYGMLGS
jgi:hypothetical protein